MKYGRKLQFFCCFFTTFALVKPKIRRYFSAWLLLVAFVPMLLLSSAHVHQRAQSAGGNCEQCTHHKVHYAHLAQADAPICDCVLCQIFHLTFLKAAPACAAVPESRTYALPQDGVQVLAKYLVLPFGSRAPPVV